MPTKKRTVEEDAESSPPGSPGVANKRPRTAGNKNEKMQSKGRGKGKGRAVDSEYMDDGDIEGEEPNVQRETSEESAEKDKQFEDAHYDKILESVKSRGNSGTVADYGIIEKVELYQFMCHQRLTFSFGPQTNFIIGHNGSGKSAVLSAITIALGGKTISTGRGNGLKAFIREGENAAEVSIQLKNKGDEAYRHKDFGDSIIIYRRFTSEGSSTWKIKSKDGRVISTKRDDLSKICDHMNIQIDNPLTVLTQDASRVFLASSNPSERYNFFLKGTQLQQLSDEYTITLENIRSTHKVLEQKKGAISELKGAADEAQRRHDEAKYARQQKEKQDGLKKELAWAHVKSKEEEFTRKVEEVNNLAVKLPRIEAELQGVKAKFDAAAEELTKHEQELEDFGDDKELEKRKHELNEHMKANKARLAQLNSEMKSMNTDMESLRRTISGYEQSIAQETQRLAKNTQAKRDQIQNKLAELQAQVVTHKSNIDAMKSQKEELASKKSDAERRQKALEAKRDELAGQIRFRHDMIKNCEQAGRDNLLPYGRNIKGVLNQIDGCRWYGNKPLGPLGVYVNARDPQTWGEVLRSQLAQQLCSFAITDPRDRDQLKNLLMSSQNGHVQIVICSTELFDFSAGEPPSDYLTVLRALEITDPFVMRILVNNANIESRVLAKTRFEAQQSLERLPKGGTAYTLDHFLVRVFPDGVSSTPLDIRRSNDSSNLMLAGRDSTSEIRRAHQEINKLNQEINEIKPLWGTCKNESEECRKQLGVLQELENRELAAQRNLEAMCQKLSRELNEEMPMNINTLIDSKKEAEDEVESIKVQFVPLMQEKNEVDKLNSEYLGEREKIRERLNHFSGLKKDIKEKVEVAATNRLQARSALNHYEAKLKKAKEQLNQEKEAQDILEQEFKAWTEKASEFCDRVEANRSVAEIERLRKSIEEALKRHQANLGVSLEELDEQFIRAKEQYRNARENIRAMVTLNKRLEKSLIYRYGRWENFRRHIALRTKVVFQYHLSQRGYFGKLLFDHGARTLTLKVQTDDQASQMTQKEKDPRSLSGGEKSFSTICLLLALWESIGCPIRCLDEFDVFMDAVNRRISMKMMIDTANASNQKQYILITPLDMSNVAFGTSVRVHKMNDPQRNQGTLAFSS